MSTVENITKAWHSSQFLCGSLREAHSVACPRALEMVLFEMIEQAEKIRQRLEILALEDEGSDE